MQVRKVHKRKGKIKIFRPNEAISPEDRVLSPVGLLDIAQKALQDFEHSVRGNWTIRNTIIYPLLQSRVFRRTQEAFPPTRDNSAARKR